MRLLSKVTSAREWKRVFESNPTFVPCPPKAPRPPEGTDCEGSRNLRSSTQRRPLDDSGRRRSRTHSITYGASPEPWQEWGWQGRAPAEGRSLSPSGPATPGGRPNHSPPLRPTGRPDPRSSPKGSTHPDSRSGDPARRSASPGSGQELFNRTTAKRSSASVQASSRVRPARSARTWNPGRSYLYENSVRTRSPSSK